MNSPKTKAITQPSFLYFLANTEVKFYTEEQKRQIPNGVVAAHVDGFDRLSDSVTFDFCRRFSRFWNMKETK